MRTRENADGEGFTTPTTVVIVYDDLEFALATKTMLDNAARDAGETTPWAFKPWRASLLMHAALSKEALDDAADARLVVLALRYSRLLPEHLQAWLHDWARDRQIQDAALAVWECGGTDHLAPPAIRELTELTEHSGMRLICQEILRDWSTSIEPPDFAQDLQSEAGYPPPTHPDPLGAPARDKHLDWGINE